MVLIHFFLFFFNDTATTEIYTLSLHDALPIYVPAPAVQPAKKAVVKPPPPKPAAPTTLTLAAGTRVPLAASESISTRQDRKSTRLNSSHVRISYAVFCLKKKTTSFKPVVL